MVYSVTKVKRMTWEDKNMRDALKAVVDDRQSVKGAAKKFNVPRRTLADRVNGRVRHGSHPGPKTALSKEEEDVLCSYLIYMAERGFPLTPKMVMAFAWAIAIRCGRHHCFSDSGPTKRWWLGFRRRHPKLSLRKVDKLERSRAECLSPEVVCEYFELLKKTLSDKGILNSPRSIFNCDETFLPLDESREKAVTVRNAKSVYSQSPGTTEHITMLCCASASGGALPPMIIYPKAFPGGQYRFGGPDDTVYARSESGWVDSDLFLQWFKKVFLKYTVHDQPLLLLVDGHKSHMTLELVDLARENNVILFCLPPHTTHALQPLDVSVFKALKAHFSRSLRALCFTRKDFIVTKRDFARVVKEPFEMAFSMTNIKNGFAKCGIFPFNPDAVDKKKMLPSEMHKDSVEEMPPSVRSSVSTPTGQSSSPPPVSDCSESLSSGPVAGDAAESVCGSSTSNQFTPLLCNTPSTSDSATSNTAPSTPCSRPIVNPLVSAGLIPSNLSDILSPPSSSSQPKRRVIRVLTEDEFTGILREKERKEKEAAEKKEQNRLERERKRVIRKKAHLEREKKNNEKSKQKKGGQKGVRRAPEVDSDSSGSDQDDEPGPSPRPVIARRSRLPSRYRILSDESSDGNESDTQCAVCQQREPQNNDESDHIFWIDCEVCDVWCHTVCAFGKNAVTGGNTFVNLVCNVFLMFFLSDHLLFDILVTLIIEIFSIVVRW